MSHALPVDSRRLISALLRKPARHKVVVRLLLVLLTGLVRLGLLVLLVWLARLTVMLDSPNSLKQPRNRYPGYLMFGPSQPPTAARAAHSTREVRHNAWPGGNRMVVPNDFV